MSNLCVGFPSGSSVKNLSAMLETTRDTSSIPGSGQSPGREHGNLLQYSCLGNPVDRLEGYSPYVGEEPDTTEATEHACTHKPFGRRFQQTFKVTNGTSLVVQWLRLCASSAGAPFNP